MTLGAPEGPLDALICLVGRDWGFDERAASRSFVGASGKVLNRALAKAGIERGHCLISNVVNVQPAGNKWELHSDDTIRAGIAALEFTLGASPRRLIVALGAEAFQACRGRDPNQRLEEEFDGNGITELRGYVFEGPFGPVLASTHPAFVLRTWLPWWPLLCWDLAKAKRLSVDGVVGSGDAPNEWIVDIPPVKALTRTVAIDIETTGEHAEIIKCVGFAWCAEEGFVMRFNEQGRDGLAELLASPAPKVFHNGQFDVTILERHGFTVNNWTEDTMILWHCLEPLLAGKKKEKGDSTQKSLRFLASLLTDEPFWKNYQFEDAEQQLQLCARDARVTWACWDALRQRLANCK
jgi:uracil-DNA glycosylase family 4